MLSQQEEAAAFIMRKRRMEPVKKMPSAEFTIQWKEIARIGKRGKHVTCKCKLHRTNGFIQLQGVGAVQISKHVFRPTSPRLTFLQNSFTRPARWEVW